MVEGKFLNLPEKKTLHSFILDKGLIDKRNFKRVLNLKKLYKDEVSKIFLSEEILNSKELYSAVAEHLDCDFVDLQIHPCDKSLFRSDDMRNYISMEFVPWKSIGPQTYIAASHVTDALFEHLKSIYYAGFKIVISSPQDIRKSIQSKFGHFFLNEVNSEIKKHAPEYSSHALLGIRQKLIILSALVLTVVAGAYNARVFVYYSMILFNIIFLANTIFKALLFFRALRCKTKLPSSDKLDIIPSHRLPVYTILLPLYKEESTIDGLLKCIRSLEYPKSKLDVVLIVEQFDKKTISRVEKENKDGFFKVICVPYGYPKTKPKACSYALQFARGKYLTIYDADDRPEPLQLLKSVAAFCETDTSTVCLQARLNYYNREESILAYLFSLEYFGWFDVSLIGLESLNMPIPLGGNSNHFKTDKLKELRAWDPYNVAEDADLGYRLAKHRYNTRVLNSVTLEEAPITLKVWLMQRTRWFKGYIQTYIVHLRSLSKFKQNKAAVIGFHMFCIIPITSYCLQLLMLSWFMINANIVPNSIKCIIVINFLLSVFVLNTIALYGIIKNRWYKMSWTLVVYPFYYLLHGVAVLIAVYELIFKPHHWNKTPHDYSERVRHNNVNELKQQ